MRPKTRLRIIQASEDWMQGYKETELAAKYGCKVAVTHTWKRTPLWKKCVAGRVRLKRKPPVRYDVSQDIKMIRVTAEKWVQLGKPVLSEFEKHIRVDIGKVEYWMTLPYWEEFVLYAESRKERKERLAKRKEKHEKQPGWKMSKYLLIQAAFLHLAGWSTEEIGKAIGTCKMTVWKWQQTNTWIDVCEEVMADKLLMHLLDYGMTTEDMYRKMCASQGVLIDRGGTD